MAQLISFYSPLPSQGKRTLSMAFANLLAQNEHKVLYVELDLNAPAVALATQISHEARNVVEYLKTAHETDLFQPNSYILKHQHLLASDKRKYQQYPENLDFLTIPKYFDYSKFPIIADGESESAEEVAFKFIQKLTYEMAATTYDYVIFNLPNEINDLFGYEMLRHSDLILNIVTPSPFNMSKYLDVKEFLEKSLKEVLEKSLTIVNMASLEIDQKNYKEVFQENDLVLVPYDLQRQLADFSLQLETQGITQSLEFLASKISIPLPVSTAANKPKGLFKVR